MSATNAALNLGALVSARETARKEMPSLSAAARDKAAIAMATKNASSTK